MKPPPEVKRLNRQLESHFGIETESMNPMWRVVWSGNQIEKRKSEYSPAGILLLSPEIFEFPKYPWAMESWMLENLVIVPEPQQEELCGITKSYECIYKFPNRDGKPIIPSFEACKFIIDLIYATKGKKSMRKYIDEEAQNPVEARNKRIDSIMEELYGDESFLLGRTVTGEAVAMPQNYESQKE